jgi:hypothetical protein
MQPDTWGMVQDPEQKLEERLEKIEPQRSRQDQNDILYVKNVDKECSDISYDVMRITEKWRDPDPESRRRVITRFRDITNSYDHSKGFTVKWSGQPFSIPPGQVMRLPRYIGEHYASKLADHMLDKRGIEKMLRNDPIQRPAMLSMIIIKIEPFAAMMPETVGGKALAQVEELNATPVAPFVNDDGKTYNTQGQRDIELNEADATPVDLVASTVGNMRKDVIEDTIAVIARLPETPEDALNVPEKWQGTSKADMIRLIRDMVPDYKFGSNVSKSQLVGILQRM